MDVVDMQKRRAVADRRTHLINELYKLGLDATSDGRQFEECTLFTLEHIHINEKCRAGRAYGDRS